MTGVIRGSRSGRIRIHRPNGASIAMGLTIGVLAAAILLELAATRLKRRVRS